MTKLGSLGMMASLILNLIMKARGDTSKMQPRSVATGNTKSMIDGGRYSTSVVDGASGQHATVLNISPRLGPTRMPHFPFLLSFPVPVALFPS